MPETVAKVLKISDVVMSELDAVMPELETVVRSIDVVMSRSIYAAVGNLGFRSFHKP